jgi:hypothetical protein
LSNHFLKAQTIFLVEIPTHGIGIKDRNGIKDHNGMVQIGIEEINGIKVMIGEAIGIEEVICLVINGEINGEILGIMVLKIGQIRLDSIMKEPLKTLEQRLKMKLDKILIEPLVKHSSDDLDIFILNLMIKTTYVSIH